MTNVLSNLTINRKLKAYGNLSNTTAIIRETPDSKSSEKKNKQVLEIWKNGYLFNSVDLQLFDKHGKVYTDGITKLVSISATTKIIYISHDHFMFHQFILTSY